MNNLYQDTINTLKMYQTKANKSLGQNFLINQEVLDKIVESSNISKEDIIIEIGPGIGTLTNELIKHAKKVICIELDPTMVTILQNRFKFANNIQIIQEDILKVDLKKLLGNEKVKVVANLPYYITTPIIMKLLEQETNILSIIVMVQKEVALRLTAKPGDNLCGAITVSVNYYSAPEIVTLVQKDSFLPEPEVDSCVIKLTVREKPAIDVQDEKILFQLVKIAFQNRRKTLLNNLINAKIIKDKEKATKILEELNIERNRRGETLSLVEYEKLANCICKIKE